MGKTIRVAGLGWSFALGFALSLMLFGVPVRAHGESINAVNSAMLTLDGRELATVHYGEKTIYLPAVQQGQESSGWKYGRLVVRSGSGLALENRYVRLPGGKVGTLDFHSSDESVTTVDEAGHLIFQDAGRVTIRVSLGGAAVDIPLNLTRLPFAESDTFATPFQKQRLLKDLGYPDRMSKGWVEWPDSKWVDGILYSTSGGKVHGVSYEHWFYDDYPGLVFTFTASNRLEFVHLGWLSMPTLRGLLESEQVDAAQLLIERQNRAVWNPGSDDKRE